MAVRHGEPYVRDAIESVLAQPITAFELLIVDHASTDNTPSILSEYRRQESRIGLWHNTGTVDVFGSTRAKANGFARSPSWQR